MRFSQAELIEAFAAGADWSADQCAMVHREEQDLWHQRFADAGELITEAAGLFRSYEAHHRGKISEQGRPEKAERNRKIAEKLERWIMGRNPAEVLRDIAEGMVDGETIKGVDHASFDRAAEELARPVPWRTEGVADLGAFRITTGDPRFDPGKPVTVNGFLYVPAKEKEHG